MRSAAQLGHIVMDVPAGAAVSAVALRQANHMPITVLWALLGLLRETAGAVSDSGLVASIDEVWPGVLHDADDLDLAAWAACAVVAGRVAGIGTDAAEEESRAGSLPDTTVEAQDWLLASHRESEAISDHARRVAEEFSSATGSISEALERLFGTIAAIAGAWPAEIMEEHVPEAIARLLQGEAVEPTGGMREHLLSRGAEVVEQLRHARQRFHEEREQGTLGIRATLLDVPQAPPARQTEQPQTEQPQTEQPQPEKPQPQAPPVLPAPPAADSAPPSGEPRRTADEQLAQDPGPAGLLSRASEFGSRRRAR
ncbi:hypothetical protein HT102_08010 [Hoyosella sp. G463]|uniref:Uncharacterized protein n=1 Tax=Lolliginicoccus lacisalsi TaxID=2742202 RepID=A0A927JC33_9ACTN|nr:hypothetical protein [Lolliginicoccus lacisalsi]MBD8506425.1 hypothetical protein [Lolliginicoccus lacisalsi]